ncbi:MAG: hypothetical protein ACJAZ0_002212 [Halioglobus sp.]|jgi:hypothetical protein
MTKWKFASSAVMVAIALLLWSLVGDPLQRDIPRNLPWDLPDYRLANTHWEVGEDGRIYTQIEHFFLSDVSPEMVAWFYQQLPIATVQFDGVTYPLYHIFHPTEHGIMSVIEAAPDGTQGMASGAVIQRDEWFGPFDSRGAAKIVALSPAGMFAIPVVGPFKIGEVRHSFNALNGGTRYTVNVVIGSQSPLLGPLLNLYLRNRVFHPEMLEQWQRHQIEEVASLQFFLPQIYAQRDSGTHFVLE